METPKHDNRLTIQIAIAIVVAIVLALLLPNVASSFAIGGELFLRSLKMIVVPLVFTSVMCGVLGLGDVRQLGKPGAAAVIYYTATTFLAVIVGLIVVNIVQPGEGFDQGVLAASADEQSAGPVVRDAIAAATGLEAGQVAQAIPDLPAVDEEPNIWVIIENLALMLVADNLIDAAATTQLLPIIVFAIAFAALLTTMPDQTRTIISLITEGNEALLRFVMLLMKIAPIGIFCLVTARFGAAQAEGKFLTELQQIGWYFATVLIGLSLHALITLPLIYWVVTRQNPFKYIAAMAQAILTAFSTASSSATLPVTLECTTAAGVPKRSSEFVVPLGATINMDGTALYEAAAAIFIAQAVGMDLSLGQQAIVAMTATLAAIGAAGIPEAGLFTMLIVLNAVGLPLQYIGLIVSVDWLLDRFRTAVNVLGDSFGAAVVATTMPPVKIEPSSSEPPIPAPQ